MKYSLIAKTFSGLEEILTKELIEIGAEDVKPGIRSVYFTGNLEIIYKANLYCRTALKILMEIKSFDVLNEDDLYKGAMSIPWENYMDLESTFAVDCTLADSNITHSKYAALKTKDAIADHFRKLFNERPNVELEHPDLRVHVHISKNICTISIDSSGQTLFKRGYKSMSGEAPMSEVLAAGVVLLSNWDQKSTLIDFMCGTGTILIEAALIAKKIAPGIFRKEFGFQKWKNYDTILWKKIIEEARAMEIKDPGFEILGYDISSKNIETAEVNIMNAGLFNFVKLSRNSFEKIDPPKTNGCVIVNPPYGNRLHDDEDFINGMYKMIGDILKTKYKGYTAWIFTGNLEAAKKIGLRPTRKIHLFNGQIPSRLLKFELYEGSKKGVKNKEE